MSRSADHSLGPLIVRLLSVNVGMPKSRLIDGREVTTAIFKSPASGAVVVDRLGAAGDGQGNLRNHGGPDQALSVYSNEHYRFWGARFCRDDLVRGIFGENLTVEGMTETEVCIGDVFAIGSTVAQVTHPRTPCTKLNHRLGLPLFDQQQLQSGRIGYLLRVLKEGEIAGGDEFVLIERDVAPVTVAQCIAATLFRDDLADVLRRLDRQLHLSQKWRAHVAARLSVSQV
jgi:MOSC domain-containing protein YiiM